MTLEHFNSDWVGREHTLYVKRDVVRKIKVRDLNLRLEEGGVG